MRIDPTTMSDLEVFRSTGGHGGVFDVVDRTSTSLGRAALRRRMSRPSSRIAEIRRTQDAVRFLSGRTGPLGLQGEVVDEVARYLRSNIEARSLHPLREKVERAWMAVRYPGMLEELKAGIQATRALFVDVNRLADDLLAQDPPDLIRELAGPLLDTSNVVLRNAGGEMGALRVDHLLREDLHEDLGTSLERLGELDALASMAEATRSLGWVMPDLLDDDRFVLEAEAIRHPGLPDAVANPVTLSGGEPMLFLTGPNMAGKTTYLKSVALVVLLAQMGMGVPAARARLTPVEVLFTSLNPTDNLTAGLSYFLAEVMRVKEAAEFLARGRRSLVLFDEVFRGTNLRDALDASAEVIRGFARAQRSGFVFSSHLTELVQVLEPLKRIRFCCFDGELVEGAPHYGFELRDGVSEKRFGMLLLRQAEVPELLARIA